MPPDSILFPYTTLFRSRAAGCERRSEARRLSHDVRLAVDRPAVRGRAPRPGSRRLAPVPVVRRRDLREPGPPVRAREGTERGRSEEHTSELQSPVHLVCRPILYSFPTRRSSDLELLAASGGVKLDGYLTTSGSPSTAQPYAAELLDQVPADSLLFLSFDGETFANPALRSELEKGLSGGDRKSTRLNSSHPSISYAARFYTLSLHDALPISSCWLRAAE